MSRYVWIKRGQVFVALTLAVSQIVSCNPVPAPETWDRTDEIISTDQGLSIQLMAGDMGARQGQIYFTLFYVVLAHAGLDGWEISPRDVTISDDQGQVGTCQGIAVETVDGITLGSMVVPPVRYNASFLKIAVSTMRAKNLATGEVKELKGDWEFVPLRNKNPKYHPADTFMGVGFCRQGDLLNHRGITIMHVYDGFYKYKGSDYSRWLLGQQFRVSHPEYHEVFVLVTSEGEVRRVSANEYQRLGFSVWDR